MIVSFKCGFCNDGIKRVRHDMREHLKENHLRNELFNVGEKKDPRPQVIKEEF